MWGEKADNQIKTMLLLIQEWSKSMVFFINNNNKKKLKKNYFEPWRQTRQSQTNSLERLDKSLR